ncbi:TetR/AcrR family transcriptional regulator [Hymenobacter coccineus]|uniref:HTH tetR-type domain-containing protein n=1 Tax=Hymenobacter coccineus TaxID=1908235 RepID=A0A1G1SU29_9BACT|nr:TetR/AcrR family transcriptional regulator [Hymenobacter coccineus]OGX82125.1 hypothetical protein BEN49_02955 [Hymenobacter coccineus]
MGVTERKQREKVYREAAILEAAKKVFLEKGIVVATIDDIAAEAELGKGTLYRFYRSKEDILLAINEQASREMHQHFSQAVAGPGTGLDKILRFNRSYYEFVVANPVYFGFIAFFESPLTSTKPATVYETSNAIHLLVIELLELGKQDGSVRADLKSDLIANTIWASSYGMMQFIVSKGAYLTEERHVDLDELFATFLAMLENALRVAKK